MKNAVSPETVHTHTRTHTHTSNLTKINKGDDTFIYDRIKKAHKHLI